MTTTDYFKGQKTKIGALLRRYYKTRKIKRNNVGWIWIQDRETERETGAVELMLYGTDDGDYWDSMAIEFADRNGNPCWDTFNKQLNRIVNENPTLGKIDFRHPCNDYDWDQFTIWNSQH
jgi:hypothetical protein